MLITFKSHSSGDVIMLENTGKDFLGLMGKGPTDAKGILTLEQLPGAISAINKAVEADKARHLEHVNNGSEVDETQGHEVRWFQRSLQLIELLERSLKGEAPVTWGV